MPNFISGPKMAPFFGKKSLAKGISHTSAVMAEVGDLFLGTLTLKATNFVALWSKDPISPVWTDLKPFSKYI